MATHPGTYLQTTSYMQTHTQRHATEYFATVSRSVRVTRWSAQIFPFQFHPAEQLFLHTPLQAQKCSALLALNHNTAARKKKRKLKRDIGKLGGLRCFDLESAIVWLARRRKFMCWSSQKLWKC